MSVAGSAARPLRLRTRDAVAVIAPAGPVEPDKLAAGMRALDSWGLRVHDHTGAHGSHSPHDYLAGSDELRAKEFERAWADPSIAAVIAARGGYGCQRVIDHLDWDALRTVRPKVFAGSSDITALHAAIRARLGVATLFSPMPAGSYFDGPAAAHLRRTLLYPDSVRTLGGSDAAPLIPGRAAGITAGGNLSLLAAGAGTAEHLPPDGTIGLLEDVDEQPYRLDRMLTQLLRSGWFDGVTAIALGSWTGCGSTERVRELMLERLGRLGVPVVWNLGFGHQPGSLTVPLGVRATLNADAATLTIAEPALA